MRLFHITKALDMWRKAKYDQFFRMLSHINITTHTVQAGDYEVAMWTLLETAQHGVSMKKQYL